jgi:hypothetical protein
VRRSGTNAGRIDPCAHLDPSLLGTTARRGDQYSKWVQRYEQELSQPHEDFVAHHHREYGGRSPVWAATELLGWGSLTYLFVRVPANAAAGPGAPVPVRALPPDAVAGHDEGLSPAGQDHRARPRLRARLRRLTNYVTRSLLEAGGFGLAHTVDSEGPTLLTVTAMLAMSGP